MTSASGLRAIAPALFVALFGVCAPPVAATASAFAERSAEGSVVVLATRGSVHGIGAGTVIAKAGTHVRILTAAHVATFGTLRLRLEDGSDMPAALVGVLPGRDLALIDADVAPENARNLKPAPLANPQTAEPVHVWGSGNDGPAYETATVEQVGHDLPDGAPHGRYALGCALCHEGDSGAGIFNAHKQLVGVYIGYFEVKSGRVSVAETPSQDVALAARRSLDGQTEAAASGASQVAAVDTGDAR